MRPSPSLPALSILFVVASLLLSACAPGLATEPSTAPSLPTASTEPSAPGDCPSKPDPGQVEGWSTSTQQPSVIPVLATNRVTCGDNRILVGLLDLQNRPIAAPDRTLKARFFDLNADPTKPVADEIGTFAWGIPNVTGIYIFHTTFSHAGRWGVEFVTAAKGGQPETIRMTFDVATSTPVVRVGQKAPASKTPTLADANGDVSKLSSDPHPDKAFYETSVADAVKTHKPFVLVFATPKFCQTGECGPALDRVKPFGKAYPSVTFINVEPYELKWDGAQLQPVLTNNQLTPVPAVNEWGLLSEPWIFVVDKEGIVRGSFEGIAGDDELRAAIESVS